MNVHGSLPVFVNRLQKNEITVTDPTVILRYLKIAMTAIFVVVGLE